MFLTLRRQLGCLLNHTRFIVGENQSDTAQLIPIECFEPLGKQSPGTIHIKQLQLPPVHLPMSTRLPDRRMLSRSRRQGRGRSLGGSQHGEIIRFRSTTCEENFVRVGSQNPCDLLATGFQDSPCRSPGRMAAAWICICVTRNADNRLQNFRMRPRRRVVIQIDRGQPPNPVRTVNVRLSGTRHGHEPNSSNRCSCRHRDHDRGRDHGFQPLPRPRRSEPDTSRRTSFERPSSPVSGPPRRLA